MDLQARLLEAIRAKDPRRVKAAIAAGAKLAVANGQKSPLHVAAEVGDVAVLAALPGASVRKLVNELDGMDRTPLMYAAQKDRVEVARALIEAGADVNAKSSTGETALRITAAGGTPEMARLLLEAGGDPNLPGRMMLTPLDRARERQTPEGRMITALFVRAGEEKAAGRAGKGRKRSGAVGKTRIIWAKEAGKGKIKRPRRRTQHGVK
jgi:uncharacterized protein